MPWTRFIVLVSVFVSLLTTGTLAHLLPILQLSHLDDHTVAAMTDDSSDMLEHDPRGHIHEDPVDELVSDLSAKFTLLQVIVSLIFAISTLYLLAIPRSRFLSVSLPKVPVRPLDPPSHPPKSLVL